ncbi:MAG: aspartate/glutamate racemase family protein [Acidobacteriota bacterium]
MNQRLGMIDWGIGGVSIYKLIKEKHAHVPVTYFSDTGVTPYGKMTRTELVVRLNRVIAFLKSQGVTQVVIGCNAASTAMDLLDNGGIEVEGMIESGVAAAAKLEPKRLGLIGGRRTVVSGVYRNAFAHRGIKIEQRIAQPLSALIESGDTSSDQLREASKRILSPLRNCSHILLACTHYPAISHLLQEFVSTRTVLIDPSCELVRRIGKIKADANAADIFLTSGDPTGMKTAAMNAFCVDIATARQVKI